MAHNLLECIYQEANFLKKIFKGFTQSDIGEAYAGSTHASGACRQGSIPCSPTFIARQIVDATNVLS